MARLTGLNALAWAEKHNADVYLEGTDLPMSPEEARDLLGIFLEEGADGDHGIYVETGDT